jgi:hypothetical protein
MLKFERFQTMLILDPYGMTFDAVGVFGPANFYLNLAHHIMRDRNSCVVNNKRALFPKLRDFFLQILCF